MTDDPSGRIDTSVPQSARIWNYWLGGKDNYPVDREAGDRYVAVFPGIIDLARHSRAFLTRCVRYLAGEAGIRQFLDIGTGLPTVDNTHEVAQRVAPESRIVYVDNDPLVLSHARALLTSTPQGACAYIDADLREPEKIIQAAADTLDFTHPVALILMGILGHIDDYDEARSIVTRLLDHLPPGSHLALNDGTSAGNKDFEKAQQDYDDTGAIPYRLRTPDQVAAFFTGLDLVPPGIVSVAHWRPETTAWSIPHIDAYGGIGRKP
ncbi:SAM-dependent methyltransferase [Thermopolyspora sp. NPDC052614]|uniref:SAM-dependent methyltransferase n=1 Tax=Thermopolyspora sp. NPDC052614 TaxID=3155682 RepID=UPI0034466708